MCSLTWDECNIESHWRGSVVLKRRFLSGFKIIIFFTSELRELYSSPIILTCTTSLLFWLILSKHAGCSALIHLVALQKKIHTKQQQERGLGGEAATFFFLWHETQNAKHSTFNLCLLPQWEHTVPRAPPPQRVTHAVTFMGWGISAVCIYNDFSTSMHALWSCALSISNGRRFL